LGLIISTVKTMLVAEDKHIPISPHQNTESHSNVIPGGLAASGVSSSGNLPALMTYVIPGEEKLKAAEDLFKQLQQRNWTKNARSLQIFAHTASFSFPRHMQDVYAR
jgi:hypothetical protein